MFTGVFGHSILKRAEEMNAASFQVINFREYADNKHGTVDDYPYGGGAGMVLKPQPIFDAVEDLKAKSQSETHELYFCALKVSDMIKKRPRSLRL